MGYNKGIPGLQFFAFTEGSKLFMPLFSGAVQAGFSSPADDYIENKLDLNELVEHPEATFFVRVNGYSMVNARLNPGDLLMIDRAVKPKNDSVVLAVLDGEFTVKRLQKRGGKVFLIPENPSYSEIEIMPETDFTVWGVVTYAIRKMI